MRRRLFTFFSAVSLLLCVAVCVLWVRSRWVGDVWEWQRVTRDDRVLYAWSLQLASGSGGIGLSRDAEDYDLRAVKVDRTDVTDWSFARREQRRPAYPQPVFFAGPGRPAPAFAFRWNGNRAGTRRELIVPYWALALPFAIAPASGVRRLWVRLRARRRRRADRCPACGYDLRATPERCPECGKEARVSTA